MERPTAVFAGWLGFVSRNFILPGHERRRQLRAGQAVSAFGPVVSGSFCEILSCRGGRGSEQLLEMESVIVFGAIGSGSFCEIFILPQ
jgi:hypothetical protein